VILVQSAIEPDWDYAFHNAKYLLAAPPDSKEVAPSFNMGQKLRFRLLANPTRKIDTKSGPDGKRRHGKRVPVPDDTLLKWLVCRAEQGGFSVEGASVIVQPGYVYVNKDKGKGEPIRYRSAQYEGNLEVTDPERFRETIIRGIGPAKAFGFGLLSVAPVR
jgi:CRISPR system Cascade subunit CasE